MAELSAKSAFSAGLPKTIGSTTLAEADLGPITSLAAYQGAVPDLSAYLEKQLGLTLPPALGSSHQAGLSCFWAGQEMWFLTGAAPVLDVAHLAAVTDQTDAWAAVRIDGAGATEVLARLVPVDLRTRHFGDGAVLRTMLGHMNVLIARIEEGFVILAFRSMADTLVHELVDAMTSVAGRVQAQ